MKLLECLMVSAVLALGACAIDEDDGVNRGSDETLSETSSEISVQKWNVTTMGGPGLCLWRGGTCMHMPECTTFWVESVNWSTGKAWGYSSWANDWGHADKDWLTAGRHYYYGSYWCAAAN
jgi:hypothetical protein